MLMIKFNGAAFWNWFLLNCLRNLMAVRAIWRKLLITRPSNGKRKHTNELYTHFGNQSAFFVYQARSSLIQLNCNSTNASKFRWLMWSRVRSNGGFRWQYSNHMLLSICLGISQFSWSKCMVARRSFVLCRICWNWRDCTCFHSLVGNNASGVPSSLSFYMGIEHICIKLASNLYSQCDIDEKSENV